MQTLTHYIAIHAFWDEQHPTINPCGTDFDSDKSGTVLEVPGHLEGILIQP